MPGYLIFHPKRHISRIDDLVIYHDSTRGNQDPYIWNRQFLHTYCHITQMSPKVGHINFWVSGDSFPQFTQLYCDLVFVVQEIKYWQDRNLIDPNDPIVETDEAYNDHYQWAELNHPYKRRRRFTLKADPFLSFQPQTEEKDLIDIMPFILQLGITVETLRYRIQANFGSRPIKLDDEIANKLYERLQDVSLIKLRGDVLGKIRREHAELVSPLPKNVTSITARQLADVIIPIKRSQEI
jgi:hypothetical protein